LEDRVLEGLSAESKAISSGEIDPGITLAPLSKSVKMQWKQRFRESSLASMVNVILREIEFLSTSTCSKGWNLTQGKVTLSKSILGSCDLSKPAFSGLATLTDGNVLDRRAAATISKILDSLLDCIRLKMVK